MPTCNISPTTGEEYYSGTWENIQSIVKGLDIGEGKLAEGLSQLTINEYQETIDRNIDDILTELYHVPLLKMNQKQPDGTTKKIFPGSMVRAARYWTAGLILLNEFQQLAQNVTEQAQGYVDDSRREIFKIVRYNHRLYGQRRKSHMSRTMPPGMQPPAFPEPDF